MSRIYENIKRLADFPEMGPVIPEEDAPGVQRGYGRIVVSPYMVFYRVMEDHIVRPEYLESPVKNNTGKSMVWNIIA